MSKRLTQRNEKGEAYVQLYSDPDRVTDVIVERAKKEKEVIERLAHYEDLEEEGRLIKLPCAIGDKLFFIKKTGKEAKIIVERKVTGFSIEKTGIWITYGDRRVNGEVYRSNINAQDIGNTVFLDKETAIAALKECEQE